LVKKGGHLFMGLERPECLASFHLVQRLSEAVINNPPLGWRVFTINNNFWGENGLSLLRFGFHNVTVNQAHLDTKAGGNGHLTFALDSNDGDPFTEVGNPSFLKLSIKAHQITVKGACPNFGCGAGLEPGMCRPQGRRYEQIRTPPCQEYLAVQVGGQEMAHKDRALDMPTSQSC
jgi:hypothetical protein